MCTSRLRSHHLRRKRIEDARPSSRYAFRIPTPPPIPATRDLMACQSEERRTHYRILQLLFFFLLLTPPSFEDPLLSGPLYSSPTAMVMAVSKISSTPVISLLLHSMYVAPIRSATARPCSVVTGVRPCVLRSSMQFFLCRRSDFRPSRITGVVGQKWRTSGYHCS